MNSTAPRLRHDNSIAPESISKSKVVPEPQEPKQFVKLKQNTSYLLLDSQELADYGISPCRIKLADIMRSKPMDVLIIILIIIYTILVFLIFGIEDPYLKENPDLELSFYIIELTILGIFVVEIFLSTVAFGKLYYRDSWNIFDVLVIILSLAFVLMDLTIENTTVRGFFKIRGIFRLLRVFILVRKLNVLRVKRDIQKKKLGN